MKRLTYGVIVAFAAALSACSFADQSVPIACAQDQACLDGQVCILGTCVDPNDQRLSIVDLEIEPGAQASLPLQSVLDLDLRAVEGRVDVELRPAVQVTGDVLDDTQAGVLGRLLLRPERFIPGRALAQSGVTDDGGHFAIPVVDGDRYALSFTPNDSQRPPFFDDDAFEVDGGASGAFTLSDIVLPSTLFKIRGRVVAGEGVATIGIENLEVRAQVGTRTVSSIGKTSSTGAFEIAVPAERDDYRLVIAPTPDNASYPKLVVEGVAVSEGADVDVGEISLGAVVGPERVFVTVRNADDVTVPFARIIVRGPLGNGQFELVTDADASGNATLDLRHGTYDVIVAGPPSDAAAGLLLDGELVVPAQNEITIVTLPRRVSLAGVVIDSFGRPLTGVELSIARVPPSGAQPDPALQSLAPFVVTSDADGTYATFVDPGDYRIAVRAPAGSGAPGFSERVIVGADGLPHDIVLPGPAFVVGSTLSGDVVVPNAYIRVFSSLLDERGAAILLGEGESGPDGGFEIVVPDIVPDDV